MFLFLILKSEGFSFPFLFLKEEGKFFFFLPFSVFAAGFFFEKILYLLFPEKKNHFSFFTEGEKDNLFSEFFCFVSNFFGE